MSKKSDKTLAGIPMKPYDLLREGIIVLGAVTAIVVILASVLSSPDYPQVRGQDVANRQPITYLKTAAITLAGKSSVQNYGPPYTEDRENAQSLFGIAPANWFGVRFPINAAQDFVIEPLRRLSEIRSDIGTAVDTFESAPVSQQQAWLSAYLSALEDATIVDGTVNIPAGDYGPVTTMMDGMLALGKAGLLEGALESGGQVPYTLRLTRALLYFQDDVDASVAEDLDMLSKQWGVVHETGNYPGAWWLWPYAFWYFIPPMSSSPNADIQAIALYTVLFALLALLPVIPIANRLPRWFQLYKVVWRDWYRDYYKVKGNGGGQPPSGGAKRAGAQPPPAKGNEQARPGGQEQGRSSKLPNDGTGEKGDQPPSGQAS